MYSYSEQSRLDFLKITQQIKKIIPVAAKVIEEEAFLKRRLQEELNLLAKITGMMLYLVSLSGISFAYLVINTLLPYFLYVG